LAVAPELHLDYDDGNVLALRLSGPWAIEHGVPPGQDLLRVLQASPSPTGLRIDTSAVERWDTTLVAFLKRVFDVAQAQGIPVDEGGLPNGVTRLLTLARAVPEHEPSTSRAPAGVLDRLGQRVLARAQTGREMVDFLGEVVVAFARWGLRRSRLRVRDLLWVIEESGPRALWIVGLIALLVGTILAFIGAIQLRQFGAQIYVADLVGLAMAREMGPMMTAIIMAGRTGASFAARLGTMTVNEEIDALQTMGISPVEFLVLPRVIALAVMMPLLCIFADVIGIAGGALIGISMLDLTLEQYLVETQLTLDLADLGVGLVKSVVFGVIVALAGCFYGIRCGRSASAVGQATTSAVVHAIVAIIIVDAVFAVLTHVMDV
jgi:phospholipid/cholesterol/gamma-HCH transport system permease protein